MLNFLMTKIRRKITLTIISIIIFSLTICSIFYIVEQNNLLYNEFLNNTAIFSEYTTSSIIITYKNYFNLENIDDLIELKKIYNYVINKQDSLYKFIIVNNKNEVVFDSIDLKLSWDKIVKRNNNKTLKNYIINPAIRQFSNIKIDEENLLEVISPYIENNNSYKYSVIYYFKLSSIQEKMFYLILRIVLLELGTIIVGIIISIVLSGEFLKPLSKITNSIIDAASGDYSINLDVSSKDEISILANAFDNLIQKIKFSDENYKEKLEKNNLEIQKLSNELEKKKWHLKMYESKKNKNTLTEKEFDIDFVSKLPTTDKIEITESENLQITMDNVINYINSASKLLKNNQVDEALHIYLKIIDAFPNRTKILNNIGILFLKKGKYDEAKKYFNRVLELDTQFIGISDKINLTKILTSLREENQPFIKKESNKEKKSNVIYDINIDNALNYIEKASELYNNGKVNESLDIYLRILDIFPEGTKVLNNVAVLYLKEKEYKKALTFFNKVKKLQPNFEGIDDKINLTNLLIKFTKKSIKQNITEPAPETEKKININNVLNYIDTASNLYRNSQIEDALNIYLQILDVFPDKTKILYNIGVLYLKKKNYDKALLIFNKVKDLDFNYKDITQKINLVKILLRKIKN